MSYLPDCLVCGTPLRAPGDCSKCGPLKFYTVEQPRIRRVIYRRKIWAPNEEAAIRIAETGTAWPEEYDEHTVERTVEEYSATEITDEQTLKIWGRDAGFPED